MSFSEFLKTSVAEATDIAVENFVKGLSDPTKNNVNSLAAVSTVVANFGNNGDLENLWWIVLARCIEREVEIPPRVAEWAGLAFTAVAKPSNEPLPAEPCERPAKVAASQTTKPRPVGQVIPLAATTAPQPATSPARTAELTNNGNGHIVNNAMAVAMAKAMPDTSPDKAETLKSFRRLMAVENGNPRHWEAANTVVARMLEGGWFGDAEWKLLVARLRQMMFLASQNTEAFVAACPKDILSAFVFDGEDSLKSHVAEIAETRRRTVASAYRLIFVSECCKAFGHDSKVARELKGACGKIIDEMVADKVLPATHWIAKQRSEATTASHRPIPPEKYAKLEKPEATLTTLDPAESRTENKPSPEPATETAPQNATDPVSEAAAETLAPAATEPTSDEKPVVDEQFEREFAELMLVEEAKKNSANNGNNAGVASVASAEQPAIQ